jgi:hypothetical protein
LGGRWGHTRRAWRLFFLLFFAFAFLPFAMTRLGLDHSVPRRRQLFQFLRSGVSLTGAMKARHLRFHGFILSSCPAELLPLGPSRGGEALIINFNYLLFQSVTNFSPGAKWIRDITTSRVQQFHGGRYSDFDLPSVLVTHQLDDVQI